MRERAALANAIASVTLAASILALSGCGGAGTASAVTCPGCGLAGTTVTYTGSFVQGAQPDPVRFTAVGETAIVTFTTIQNGSVVAPTTVSVETPVTIVPCSAVMTQSGPAAGQLTITSTDHGTCTLLVSGNFGGRSLTVIVP